MTILRSDYIAGRATFGDYYGQFCNERVNLVVLRRVGLPRIIASKDPHFNDIPLREWDGLSPLIADAIDRNMLREAEGWTNPSTYPWSLNTAVCIAKQAATIIRGGGKR